jgi:hypothetical protein
MKASSRLRTQEQLDLHLWRPELAIAAPSVCRSFASDIANYPRIAGPDHDATGGAIV